MWDKLITTLPIVALVFALCASSGWAEPKIQMAVDFAMGFPQGEFGDNVDNTGLGMNFDILYRLSQGPLLIGGSVGFLTYGKHSRTEPFSTTVPDLLVTVDTTNNILPVYFLLRYQPATAHRAVRPYAEGLFGFQYLWTQTSIANSNDDLSSTNLSDTVWSAGAGGGLFVRLLQGGIVGGAAPAYSIDLKLGVRYLWGGTADYLTEDSIVFDNGSPVYFVRTSRTNLLAANIGVAFSF